MLDKDEYEEKTIDVQKIAKRSLERRMNSLLLDLKNQEHCQENYTRSSAGRTP